MPHPEAPFALRKRPRKPALSLAKGMLQEAPNSALWNVLRGRFAAPQDEGAGFWVRLLSHKVNHLLKRLKPCASPGGARFRDLYATESEERRFEGNFETDFC